MRVPVSIVVRMNSASNMIAKWYQYFDQPVEAAGMRRFGEDQRHADGQRHRAAGPAAERLADALLDLASSRRARLAVGGRRPIALRAQLVVNCGPLGEVDVDVVVHRVRQRRGGDQGDDADQALDQHRAVADRADVASPCRSSSGVVPDETSAWNPEIAPHMMQMKTNGKIGAGEVGPPPRRTRG